MTFSMERILLASASPRRQEILTLLGVPFDAMPASGEAEIDPVLPLEQAVLKVARGKAEEVAAAHPGRTVIGADTVVAVGGQVLGKPRDKWQAHEMLKMLQGRTHKVVTAVWVISPDTAHNSAGGPNTSGKGFADRTCVEFYPMTDDEIDEYIATGDPMDKAGGYGIQGRGLRYIRSVNGDFYTVMGLPAAHLWHFLCDTVLNFRNDFVPKNP